MSRLVDADEVIKCLEEVSSEDKADAIALLEWAIDKRTVQAVPISALQELEKRMSKEIDNIPWTFSDCERNDWLKNELKYLVDYTIRTYANE